MRLALACLAGLLPLASAQPAKKAAAAATDLVLIFDTSGSMNEPVRGGRKLELGKDAMWKFVELLPKSTNVGLVAFENACDVRTIAPLVKSTPETRALLKSSIARLRAEGSTPIGYAVERATQMLRGSPREKRIVILTDGEETCDQNRFDEAADAAWKAGIKVYAIGFSVGAEPSRNFRRLGIYKDAGDDKQLASVFSDIRRSLEKDSKFDEGKAAAPADAPAVSLVGRKGRFKMSEAEPRTGRLYHGLDLKSSFEPRFKETDHFTVLEHGYNVMFDEEKFKAEKVEVLKVRLDETLNLNYAGAEGFVLAGDVIIE